MAFKRPSSLKQKATRALKKDAGLNEKGEGYAGAPTGAWRLVAPPARIGGDTVETRL